MSHTFAPLQYLTGSHLVRDPQDHIALLQNISDRRHAIVILTACVTLTAAVAAFMTRALWPFLWLTSDIVLTFFRWRVMRCVSAGNPIEQLQCGRRLALLTLLWSVTFGIAMFLLVLSGNEGMMLVSTILTIVVSGVITCRNAAMPRTAIPAIIFTALPFIVAIGTSLQHTWLAVAIGLPLFASFCSLTVQNHKILVRLVTAERQARDLAYVDALTGLANRRSFLEHQDSIADIGRPRCGYSYLCLDLDGFKKINDQHGHEAGDLLLTSVGQRLRQNVRSGDLVFRTGGDEFVVYMPAARPSDCATAAARIIECLGNPFDLYPGIAVSIGCSVGSASLGETSRAASNILRSADEALYKAKVAGKCRHVHAA